MAGARQEDLFERAHTRLPFEVGRGAEGGEPAPIQDRDAVARLRFLDVVRREEHGEAGRLAQRADQLPQRAAGDRKSTRLNSSHGYISYAVFCLKKKKKIHN